MPNRGRGGRAPSGPWGRLKPVELDPLESIGLPSKGDNRLLDAKAQERYYTKIVERYMTFCSDAGQRDELLRRFSSLDIGSSTSRNRWAGSNTEASLKDTNNTNIPPSLPTLPADSLQKPADTKGLSDVMAALRKLREGIVASKRADDFSTQAYLFCIRLSILVKQPESYHPAILHLLRGIHPQHPLTSVELQETAAYLVLDTACRRRDLSEAFSLLRLYNVHDGKVKNVLRALAHDNYVVFQRVKRGVDGHRARIMEWAEGEIRMQTLKCFGRAYLAVELEFLETATGSTWRELTRNDGVGWNLDGSRVVIRKVRGM